MKVYLIKKQSIEDYINRNTQSQVPFKNWLSIVKYAIGINLRIFLPPSKVSIF